MARMAVTESTDEALVDEPSDATGAHTAELTEQRMSWSPLRSPPV